MLGRMEALTKGLALLAGYNIRIVLITQGLGQLQEIYRQGTEDILQNCACKSSSPRMTTARPIGYRAG